MTIIKKISDRDGLILNAVEMILVNMGDMSPKQLRWELFNRGIYIPGLLLMEVLQKMKETGHITKPNEIEKAS